MGQGQRSHGPRSNKGSEQRQPERYVNHVSVSQVSTLEWSFWLWISNAKVYQAWSSEICLHLKFEWPDTKPWPMLWPHAIIWPHRLTSWFYSMSPNKVSAVKELIIFCGSAEFRVFFPWIFGHPTHQCRSGEKSERYGGFISGTAWPTEMAHLSEFTRECMMVFSSFCL